MPLADSLRARGVALLKRGIEDRSYSLDRAGTAVVVAGNLTVEASTALDALGQPTHDALLHVTSGAPQAGDELEQFVVWGEHPGGLRPRWGLRWKPAFRTFGTVSRTPGTRAEGTGIKAPATSTSGTIELAVIPGLVRLNPSGDGVTTRRTATALSRTAPALGLVVTDATLGSYKVVAVTPYGPWYAVQLEGSQ
jgi:hypothetical protein